MFPILTGASARIYPARPLTPRTPLFASWSKHWEGIPTRSRGAEKNCLVDRYKRDDRDYFFAYPENYSAKKYKEKAFSADELKLC